MTPTHPDDIGQETDQLRTLVAIGRYRPFDPDPEASRSARVTLVQLLPLQVLQHVLHHFNLAAGLGVEPGGGFTQDLLTLICRADPFNRNRLERGFPAYVFAVRLIQDDLDGQVAELMRDRIRDARAGGAGDAHNG